MLTLAIDTSTMVGGVALLDDGALAAEQIMNVSTTHSERLMSSVDYVLSAARCTPQDVGLIACGIGPGSFTGIRIGVSAAKGMAYALKTPLVGVPTLDALAFGRGGAEVIWALIDARHGRCYSASYTPGAGASQWGAAVRSSEYALRSIDQIIAESIETGKHVLFVGDGAIVHRERILGSMPWTAAVLPAGLAILRPMRVGLLGIELAGEGRTSDPSDLVPMYLRAPEAEIKLACGGITRR